MKVQLYYLSGARKGEKKFVEMEAVPREGQLLVSGNDTYKIEEAVYTPEDPLQAVILRMRWSGIVTR